MGGLCNTKSMVIAEGVHTFIRRLLPSMKENTGKLKSRRRLDCIAFYRLLIIFLTSTNHLWLSITVLST